MLRMAHLTLAVAVAIGIGAVSAQSDGDASARVQSMTGVVKAVSGSLLTLERGSNEILFGVDASTRVLTNGRAFPRDLVYRIPERGPKLTDIVKVGDRVTVRYRQSGSAMNAVEVRVLKK
jgi:hypothetical protein